MSYYDFSVSQMNTHARFPENIALKDTEMRGYFTSAPLDAADVAELRKSHGEGGDALTLAVEDNGECGDGLWLSLSPATRAGDPEARPEVWENGARRRPYPLFAIELTPQQAVVLAEALLAAARLRRVDEVDNERELERLRKQ